MYFRVYRTLVSADPPDRGERSPLGAIALAQAALDPANIAETTRRLEQLGAIPSAQSKGAGGQAQAQPQAQAVPRLDKEQFKEAAKEALMDDAMAQGLSRLFDESLAAAEGRQRSGGGGGGGDGGLLDELDTEKGVAGAARASAFKFGGEEVRGAYTHVVSAQPPAPGQPMVGWPGRTHDF